ncbi:MAG: aminopeptidase [Burkholderiales bacterium]|nr:aminopeptidase [Burkholderiales bacterium]MDE1927271.1 aminopeptidase [Burkholderiales bacterium]MDE2158219.1 aminopeptidase [Burkholderiales bacterium]
MRPLRRAALAALLLAAAALLGGCASLGYYAQAIGGHLELMRRARPVAEVIADPATPPALRARLQLTQRLRDYAVRELKLPDNDSYRRYADLGRDAAVWNVVAAPELSLTLKTWCFPIMGCVGYRGYYARGGAGAEAAALRAQGWETDVYGVPAYSTLGWSNWLGGDPLLNTFVNWPEGDLARLIFHELAHQVAYAADDTTFNESFAVSVQRIGGRRWLAAHADAAARAADAVERRRRDDFQALTRRYRDQLAALYASALPPAAMRERKAAVYAALRADYAILKRERWGGYAGYDAWFARADNASFGVLAAYDELVPQFERLFEHQGGDFRRYYAEVRRLAAMPRAERRAALAAEASPGGPDGRYPHPP